MRYNQGENSGFNQRPASSIEQALNVTRRLIEKLLREPTAREYGTPYS